TANHSGILGLSSSVTTNSGSYVRSDASSILVSGGEVFECIFQHKVASGTATTIRVGFFDNSTITNPTDGCFFDIAAGSLAVVGKNYNNNANSATVTIATIATDTWYRLKVEVNSGATSVTYTIYDETGAIVGTPQSLTTNIPTGAGRNCGAGFIATNSGTVATSLAWIDMLSFYYNKIITR
ncbi:MAG TPA: hypothetical protein VLQ91_00445, partial [Draconibacterium sp.]|nr:hypothetical protein [Draconibacterium sp.]